MPQIHIDLKVRIDDEEEDRELVKLFTGDDHHDEQTC